MKYQCLQIFCAAALVSSSFAGKVIPNHAIANLVLGQTDFTTNTSGSPVSSFNMNGPTSVVVDPVTRKVFVADHFHHRILRYLSADTLASGAGAEAVLGQDSFSDTVSNTGAWSLNMPDIMFLDRLGRLWVTEEFNHRVVMYESAAYRASGSKADRVYGQPDFTTATPATTAAKMNMPIGVWVDSKDNLWVSEYGNHRILCFKAITSKPSGAAADLVLGQSDFTTSSSGSGDSKFGSPYGICVSASGALFVADASNNRVLTFQDAAALGNGASATFVLGQTSFDNSSPGTTRSSLSYPTGVFITSNDDLWVNDTTNSRILRFSNASFSGSGSEASGVVGQATFTSGTATCSNRGLNAPYHQSFVDATGSLWVPDYMNSRMLRFPPDTTKPVLVVTSSVPKTTTRKTFTFKGKASDTYGIQMVEYQVGDAPPLPATGTTSWQLKVNLTKGRNTIRIRAYDSVGNLSLTKTLKIKRL